MRIKNQELLTHFSRVSLPLIAIAFLIFCYSAYIAVAFSSQIPLDKHSFRQTQTALTAYWFLQDGYKLAYQTPVAGTPPSIPFEFPIYQVIVATLSSLFNFSLDSAGRITSYLFLFFSIFPILGITKVLKFSKSVFFIFIAIFFSSPVYLYWGRSFMIETTALFFSLAAIWCFLLFLLESRSLKTLLLFTLFSSLAILQKATTALPVLGVLFVVFYVYEFYKHRSIKKLAANRTSFLVGVSFIIPITVGIMWVNFTDEIKTLNPLGMYLTSGALREWNWGTLAERISPKFWYVVFIKRILLANLGSIFGAFLLGYAFFVQHEKKTKLVILCSVSLGVLPALLFSHLHFIHDYYQTANIVFLQYALAIVIGLQIIPRKGSNYGIAMLLLIVVSNYVCFYKKYFPDVIKVFTKDNRDLAIGEILKRELPPDMQFVAYGNDWSSTFSYVSQRKSFTVPQWYKAYNLAVANPENFVDDGKLGGIVSCASESPDLSDLVKWTTKKNLLWKIGETHDCLVAVPQKMINTKVFHPTQCTGNIDTVEITDINGDKFISIKGWAVAEDVKTKIPEHIFLVLSNDNRDSIHVEALKIPRIDINSKIGINDKADIGFSRLLPLYLKKGLYEVGVILVSGSNYQSCQLKRKFILG